MMWRNQLDVNPGDVCGETTDMQGYTLHVSSYLPALAAVRQKTEAREASTRVRLPGVGMLGALRRGGRRRSIQI